MLSNDTAVVDRRSTWAAATTRSSIGTVPLDPRHRATARSSSRTASRSPTREHDERQHRRRCSCSAAARTTTSRSTTTAACCTSHGGAGDDRFLLKTFLVLKENPDNPTDDHEPRRRSSAAPAPTATTTCRTRRWTSTAAPASTRSSSIGTPIGDTFVVTDTYIAGAGRIVTFTGIEAIEVDGAGGPDQIYDPQHGNPIRDDDRRRLGRRHDPHRRHAADARLRPAAVHLHAAGVHGPAAADRGVHARTTTTLQLQLPDEHLRVLGARRRSDDGRAVARPEPRRPRINYWLGSSRRVRAGSQPWTTSPPTRRTTSATGGSRPDIIVNIGHLRLDYTFGHARPELEEDHAAGGHGRSAAVRVRRAGPTLDAKDVKGQLIIHGGNAFENRRRHRDLREPRRHGGARHGSSRRPSRGWCSTQGAELHEPERLPALPAGRRSRHGPRCSATRT